MKLKYKNFHPADDDIIGRLLQNKIDHSYLKQVAPDQIPPSINRMWFVIKLIGVIILGLLVYFAPE